MATSFPLPLSILDLVPVIAGEKPGDALRHSLDLAQHAERLGYHRFWVAEHHNMPGIASAATAVVIAYLAGGTSTIRLGAGGIMLPNHAPLLIAEQFGTLESLYPGRIDLGLGRAPGTDPRTALALRRDPSRAEAFPEDVEELLAFLAPLRPGQLIQAIPGSGLKVPVWILGSSTFGARLAAHFGLPYAFASHFAPAALVEALTIYRKTFKPSGYLERPYTMAGVNLIAASSDAEARRLFTTAQLGFINLLRGIPRPYQPPVDDIETYWSPQEKAQVSRMLQYSIVGSPTTVREGLEQFHALTEVDELMVVSTIYEHGARIQSYELLASAAKALPLRLHDKTQAG